MTKCKRRLLPAEPYEIDALEAGFPTFPQRDCMCRRQMPSLRPS